MCNACGFYCCASDEFGECGCNHCPEPACHDHEDDDPIDYEDDYDPNEWTYIEEDPAPAEPGPASPAGKDGG